MQLSNIALATILIALFATSSVECSTLQRSSYTGSIKDLAKRYEQPSEAAEKTLAEVEALKLKGEAIRLARLGSKASSVTPSSTPAPKSTLGYPKPTPSATKARESVVRSSPSSSKSAESTGKPAQPPPKKPTIAPQPKQPLPPKVSPAPNQTTTSSQPAPGRSEHAPLFLRRDESLKTPQEVREERQAPQGSRVAGLKSRWEPAPSSQPTSSSSASPPKPTPRPAPHTSSKPSGAPPKATSIPGDTNFVRFKEAIKQGNLFYAAMIDAICGILSDPSPSTLKSYGEFLAGLDVPKILSIFDDSAQEPDEAEIFRWTQELITTSTLDPETISSRMENIDPERVTLLTSGLFLVYASDDKFSKLLEGLGELDPNFKKDVLSFSVAYSITFSPGSLPRLFKVFTEEDQAKTLDEVANEMFKSGEPESFDALIAGLQHGGALDKDSENFAFNIAFGLACKNNDLVLAQKYYGSARIFSSTYGKAILDSYDDKRSKNEVFDWLLKNAGRDALFGLEYQAPEEIKATLKRAFEAVKYKFRTHSTKSP